MNVRDVLHKIRTVATSIPARVIDYAREAAPTLSGLLMLTAGSISMANDHFWFGIGLAVIGVITIDNARDRAVERARYEGFKEGILSLLNNNGADITVTHRSDGQVISVPKRNAE